MFGRILNFLRHPRGDLGQFKVLFERFQQILKGNNNVLELLSELENKLSGEYIFDINYLRDVTGRLSEQVALVVSNLNVISGNRYPELFTREAAIREELNDILAGESRRPDERYVIDFDEVDADLVETVGGKNANLGEARNHFGMPTPDGFVVTTSAYRLFMKDNDLWPKIRALRENSDARSSEDYSRAIDELFHEARIPPVVEKAVLKAVSALRKRHGNGVRLAVRSSAFGEDALKRSFAGQFSSYLNRTCDDALESWKRVIASRFTRSIAAYCGSSLLDEEELPMAVGIQRMIPARSAGVAYSVDPSGHDVGSLSITASPGLGVAVVEGKVSTDQFMVSRLDPTRIVSRRIGSKSWKIVPAKPHGVERVPVPEGEQNLPCLTDDQVVELAEKTLALERCLKRPVDIEWCIDEEGRSFILQCRPLMLRTESKRRPSDLGRTLASKPVVMSSQGQVAQRGIAAGRVWLVGEGDDLDVFPVGAVAVTRYTTPRLTSIIRKAAAIITDVGSPSGHMATVAREFGVPMIVNTKNATELLANGEEVTVDAEENVIYKGVVRELLEYDVESEDVFRDLREYRILRRLIRKITPLFLIDPNRPDFTAGNCRTYHDIVRFCHEKAVQMLIDLNMSSRRFRDVESKRLKLPIPLGLSVIDLGGGFVAGLKGSEIDSIEAVQCIPMRALLMGLTMPGVWSTRPVNLDFGDLVSSITRFSMTDRVMQYRGQNLAVISDRYANVSLRLGYHFNVIDTYVSDNVNDNYVYFRFVGGVTEAERRNLRAILIRDILNELHFKVTVSGDLVVARLKKWEAADIERILMEIGRLIGFTRQLDTQMQDKKSVAECFRSFFDWRGKNG